MPGKNGNGKNGNGKNGNGKKNGGKKANGDSDSGNGEGVNGEESKSWKASQGIGLEDYIRIFQVLMHIEDVDKALAFYNLAGASIDPATLKHVAKVRSSYHSLASFKIATKKTTRNLSPHIWIYE